MEVIVKSSPKIEIKLATTVVKVGNGNSEVTVDSVLSYTSENPVQNKVITEELSKKVDKEEGKGLSTNDYTDEDRARTLIGGLHIGNDTQEHRNNLILAAEQGACYGPITVNAHYGTYLKVGKDSDSYYVDAIVHFATAYFPPEIIRYEINSYGLWRQVYSKDIATLFDVNSVALLSEIDALFDNGTSGDGSTSY